MSSVVYDVCNVKIKIVNRNKQLSKESFEISQNRIKEILSEIDALDKEILRIGRSNVKGNISIQVIGFKAKSYCLINLRTMGVWVPVTELGELRHQLMKYIYNDYVECQIAAVRGNNKDAERGASFGVNEKNNEYGQAEEILKEYDKWATAVKEQRKFEEAKDSYQKVKQAEDLYNSEIKRIVTVFNAIIPDLACFAGCKTSELYPDIAASLENKRRHLKAYLYRNKGMSDDLKEIPSFPDLKMMRADSDREQDGVERGDVNAEMTEEVRGFIERLHDFFERWGNNLDNGNCVEEFDSIWNQKVAYRAHSFFYDDVKNRDPALTQEEEKDKGEEIRIHRTEAEKIKKRILSYEKPWSYAQLFCMAYPIVKEIDEYPEGEMDADWCKSISERLYRLLEDFNKESGKYRFQWISYNDKECMASKSIKADFVAEEARWPGLYLCYEDDNCQKHLICVTPGSVLGV